MSVIQLVVLCLLEIFSARDKKKIQVKYITFGGIERFEIVLISEQKKRRDKSRLQTWNFAK